MKKSIIALATFCLVIFCAATTFGQESHSDPKTNAGTSISFEEMLHAWSKAFLLKIPEGYTDTLNLHVKDTNSHWHVIIANDSYRIIEGKNLKARLILTGNLDVYRQVYTGQLNAMTAAGRASIREAAPLDMMFENGMTYRQMNWEYAYFTMINFFNVHPNNKALLGREHARKVHGAHAVALYYTPGFRSAYYNIAKGETLNESGEKDPFNQSFIIISGEGYAKIGNDTLMIKANEAFYIKPNLEHKVWTDSEEGLSLIWNAWGINAW
jgi:mannose-6-phosphate isomerase-like protein (cupin superfamily)